MSYRAWLRGLLQRRKAEREIDDELAFHLEMETQANVERGMSHAAARRAALKAFGGIVQAKEMVRDVRMSCRAGNNCVIWVCQDLPARSAYSQS